MSSNPPSESADRPLDDARVQTTVRTMSDKDLAELHAQGPDALRAGAWEVLDQEVRRRERVRARRETLPEVEEERYPAIRITTLLLKVAAVLALLGGLIGAAFYAKIGIVVLAVVSVVAGLLGAVWYWALSELLVVLLDIEANTRILRQQRR